MKKSLLVKLLRLILVCAAPFSTVNAFDFYERGPYRENVPKPEEILSYKIGEHHTTYAQMETYIKTVASAAKDRVKIFEIGKTVEKRTQYLLAVSSPENIANLDNIKNDYELLSDPRKLLPEESTKITENLPIAVWLSYSIHGNESSSFETMMQVVYQLAATNENETLETLKNTVVLIVACANPDGHERFVSWYNSVGRGDPDPKALEHNEPWSIAGRFSHYRFDLNRDNIASTQIETRNLQNAFFAWNPHVSADHHGQPSQYFFPPNAEPINPNLPQPETAKWLKIFGKANAAEFDKRRWDYYSGDIFDLFYPGYWDSFPSLTGTTAMTYETDGGGYKGLRWRRDDGTISTFRDSIMKHFVASLTTLETASAHRLEKLRDFYRFKQSAITEGKTEKMKRIIIPPNQDASKTADLIEILQRLKIEVKTAPNGFSSKRSFDFTQKKNVSKELQFPPESLYVELSQPQKRLAKALLEPQTIADEKFVKEEFASFRRNEMRGKSAPRDYYRFYDITAWSLPLAFGLDAFWTEDDLAVSEARFITQNDVIQLRQGRSEGGKASNAYLIPYETDNAPILAYRLLNDGFRVHVSTRRLDANGKDWAEGTFVVRLSRNPPGIHSRIEQLSKELGVKIVAVNSGFIESGDTGIGSENVLPLKLPKIAVAAGEGIEHSSYGAIWWTFDQAGIDFSSFELGGISNRTLKDFDVLIIPDGETGKISSTIKELKDWISGGGTLICLKNASVAAVSKDVSLTSAEIVGNEENDSRNTETDKQENAVKKSDELFPPIISPTANGGKIPEKLPGAIMRATIDRTTHLTYGLHDRKYLPVLLANGNFLKLSKEGTNALVFSSDQENDLTISGFVWEQNTERLLNGTAYLIDEPVGSGHIILFADDPLFRGIFRSTKKLFFNSILIAPRF